MIIEKLQELLGSQYVVRNNDAFNRSFTTPLTTPYGVQFDINEQAFEEYENKIIVVYKSTPVTLFNLPYEMRQENYTLSFWVPINYVKYDKFGRLIEQPQYNFFKDIKELKTALTSGEIDLGDNRAFFSMSLPQLVSSTEKTGNHDRVVYQVTGNMSLADRDLATGSDTQVFFILNDTEYEIENISDLHISAVTESNAIYEQGNLETRQEVAFIGQSLSFTVDDYSSNEALNLIRDKTFKNLEKLNNESSLERQDKVKVKLKHKGEDMITFWATLNTDYFVGNKAGFGKYNVSLFNTGDYDA